MREARTDICTKEKNILIWMQLDEDLDNVCCFEQQGDNVKEYNKVWSSIRNSDGVKELRPCSVMVPRLLFWITTHVFVVVRDHWWRRRLIGKKRRAYMPELLSYRILIELRLVRKMGNYTYCFLSFSLSAVHLLKNFKKAVASSVWWLLSCLHWSSIILRSLLLLLGLQIQQLWSCQLALSL